MEVLPYVAMNPLVAGLWALLMIPVVFLLSDIYTWFYLPPGPLPIPFIGNVLSFPKDNFFLTLEEWSHIYGPIYTIWVGRSPRIIISDPAIAVELMSRRGSRYSSRPRMIVFGELFNNNSSVASLSYGSAWSIRRKVLHHSLKLSILPAYKPRQEAEALAVVDSIVGNSDNWSKAIDRFASSVVFSMAYGRRIASLDSKVLKKRQYLFRYASDLLKPGAYPVESFPFLLHLPAFLSRWKEPIVKMGRVLATFDVGLVDSVKEDLEHSKGTLVTSLTETMLDLKANGDVDTNALREDHFAALPASLFGAGSDTTASTLHSAILAFVTHPHIQKAAQAELDLVVDKHRSPTFADQPKLPYIDALVKEILRWRPSSAFGLPHATSENDVFNGYRFPKGTTIWAPAWGLNQNPAYFPSPQTFAPQRYLPESDPRYDAELGAKPFPQGAHVHGTFGFGRRACAGADLAMNSIFIALAKMLWSFDILPVEGESYDVDSYAGGIILRPKVFRCEFILRDEERRFVLEREMREAEKVLELFPPFD
ncbi:cytochrome P450 [Rhexocercosporidium sp. MPI-PUGE-AT-0058]|nr:cytochrome P450 [Rhexocercosporidium sp. MPI-PUGE-AT-0058]